MREILVIDDDPALAELLGTLKGRNYRVHICNNGHQGLLLQQDAQSVHLIILDVMMPDIDGFEVLRQMRLFFNNSCNYADGSWR